MNGKKYRILLTNDDGIYAPGLSALYQALKSDHELYVVAPESEMSAVGHAITLTSPLRVQEIHMGKSFFGYAVTGTPADCIKIAVQELLESPPDIILSGINLGANVGIDVLYSGTVSAATEGAYLGISSAAISLDTRQNPDFGFAARFSKEIIRFMKKSGLKKEIALNINIPAVPPTKIKGVCFARQGTSRLKERFERRTDPRGNVYYWLTGEMVIEKNGRTDSDSIALSENKITITPLTCNLTSLDDLKRMNSHNFSFRCDI